MVAFVRHSDLQFAMVIIMISLIAAVALIASPKSIQDWVGAIGMVVISILATIKFFAISILNFKERRRFTGSLWALLALLFVLMALQGCGRIYELIQGQGDSKTQNSAMMEGWTTWEKNAATIQYPANWTIYDDPLGSLDLEGPDGEHLTFWPMFSQQPVSEPFASKLFLQLLERLVPDTEMSAPTPNGTNTLYSAAQVDDWRISASLWWENTPHGAAVTCIVGSGPLQSWESTVTKFSKILASCHLHGERENKAGPKPAKIAYQTFRDPTEGAFTVEVPRGWKESGGVARFNASDVRPWLRITSDDGQIKVFMGDPKIPSMLVPNAALASMGFREGMIYNAGYNQEFLLRTYYPGKECARFYAQTSLANSCPNAEIVDFRDRPELSRQINSIFRQFGSPFAQQKLDTGEIALVCPTQNRAQYVFAGTLLTQMNTYQDVFSMWVLNYLYGFESPRSQASMALEITKHLASSFRVTQEWAQMNAGLQSNVSDIVAKTGAAISKTVGEGYWNAQKSTEHSMKAYGQAVLGVEETLDPVTGDKIEIVSGSNYAWVDPKGHVVGTQIDTLPGIDFRKLFKVKP